MESLDRAINTRQQVVLDALVKAEANRESIQESALEEIKKTTNGVGAVQLAYVKGVERAFDFVQNELKKTGLAIEDEGGDLQEKITDNFESMSETSDVSLEGAFDLGYKSATSAIKVLETLN